MMTNLEKVARIRLVADGLRRIQEFESARYLDEYAAIVPVEQPKDGVISVMDALRAIANYGSNANLGKTAEWMKCIARTALTANLSQPRPVAQGEAVALNAHKVIQDAIGFNFENRELQTVNEHDLLHLVDCVAKAISTPTIPTGHRVVADEVKTMAEALQQIIHVTEWTSDRPESDICTIERIAREGLTPYLAASPSAGGV
jgi:hypothetical protein